MIKLIVGSAGMGKTKMLTQLANEDIKKTRGHLVYIDSRSTRMLQIDYNIRFINAGEYQITDDKKFYGFICGIIASNYDIETIYIDGLYKITQTELGDLEEFFQKLDNIELKYNVNFVITISCSKENLPKYLTKYLIIE